MASIALAVSSEAVTRKRIQCTFKYKKCKAFCSKIKNSNLIKTTVLLVEVKFSTFSFYLV